MDKKWWIALRNNKALKLYKKYLRHIINELHEREIKGHMYRKNLNADQILIDINIINLYLFYSLSH